MHVWRGGGVTVEGGGVTVEVAAVAGDDAEVHSHFSATHLKVWSLWTLRFSNQLLKGQKVTNVPLRVYEAAQKNVNKLYSFQNQ